MSTQEQYPTVDALESHLRNLYLALAVAYIETSVEILEDLLARGRPTTDEALSRLAHELELQPSIKESFQRCFAPALHDELRATFGMSAGDALFHRLAAPSGNASTGDLQEFLSRLHQTCSDIHAPLIAFLKSANDNRNCQAQLVHAIAETGIEAIIAFQYLDRVRSARETMNCHRAELQRAARMEK